MKELKKLLLIDSLAIIHRAYHALPKGNFKNNGQTVNAVYGFYSMLISAVTEINPDYLMICFDTDKPNFRHKKFIGYQSKRPKMDQELKDQVSLVQSSVLELKVPVLFKIGFEADDIIGTLSKKANKRKLKTVIVTGDKDLMQLVNKKTSLLLMKRGLSQTVLVNPSAVKDDLGVTPDQVIDYKALVGDSSDNYPGVSGIGPKTAVKLLDQFKNFDSLYQNLDTLPAGHLKKKLEKGKDSGILSKELAKIVLDVPVNFRLSSAKWNREKMINLQEIVADLGFRSLEGRISKKIALVHSEDQMSLL